MDRDPAKEPPLTSFLKPTRFNPARSSNGLGTTPLGALILAPDPPASLSSAKRIIATPVSNGGWSFALSPPAFRSSAERSTATPVSEQGPSMKACDNHNAGLPPPTPRPTVFPVRLAGQPSESPYSRFLSNRPPAGNFNEPVIDVVTGKPFIPDPMKMAVMAVSGEGIVPNRHLAPSPYRPGRIVQQPPALKLSTPSTAEDIVSKNADSIISQNVRSAAARGIRYTPPIVRKPCMDSQRRIRRAPVDPRVIGLPQVPESRKDDGRPYAKVLVDPELRTIRFPDWIREQWLSAEWRRCESSEHVEVKSDRIDVVEYFQRKSGGLKEERKADTVAREAIKSLCGDNTKGEIASKAVEEEQAPEKNKESLAVLETVAKDPKAAEAKTESKAASGKSKIEEAEIRILDTIAAFSKAAKAADTGNPGSQRDAASAIVRQEVMEKMRQEVAALNKAAGFSKPAEVGAEVGAVFGDAQQQALKEPKNMAAGFSKEAKSNEAAETEIEAVAKAALENTRDQTSEKSKEPIAAPTQATESIGALEFENKAGEQDTAELSVLKGKAQTTKDVKEADQRIQDICKQLISIDRLEIERKNSWLQGKKHADKHAVWKRNALANLKAASTIAEELHEKMRMMEAVEAARDQRIDAKPATATTNSRQEGDDAEKGWVLLEDEIEDGTSASPGGKGQSTEVLELAKVLSQMMKEGGNSHDLMMLVDRLKEEKTSAANKTETITEWIKEKRPK